MHASGALRCDDHPHKSRKTQENQWVAGAAETPVQSGQALAAPMFRVCATNRAILPVLWRDPDVKQLYCANGNQITGSPQPEHDTDQGNEGTGYHLAIAFERSEFYPMQRGS